MILLMFLAGLAGQPGDDGTTGSFLGGEAFWSLCGPEASDSARRDCSAYIAGVVDTVRVYAVAHDARPAMCVPASVTPNDLRDAVTLRLQQSPDDRQFAAASSIIRYLADAYPCPPQDPA